MSGLIGKKIGMTRIFGKNGEDVPVTIVQAGPCTVTQVKSQKGDGYISVQLGFQDKKEKKTTKPLLGHFKKAGVSPKRYLTEFSTTRGTEAKLGDQVMVSIFQVGDKVSVKGVSKGKGFAGVVKRHGFRGGPKTHGQSDRHRAPGSIGSSSDPSRVRPGLKMAGHLGHETVRIRNLEVVKIDEINHVLYLKGAVPGPRNGIVTILK